MKVPPSSQFPCEVLLESGADGWGLFYAAHVLDAQKGLKPLFLSCLRATSRGLPQATFK